MARVRRQKGLRLLTRRQFLIGLGSVAGAVALGDALYEYAKEVEPFWPQFVERTLPVRALPGTLSGARLVHLSDIHVGDRVPDSYVLKSFERIAALAPDIVVVTGDLTQASGLDRASRVYGHLPHGRIATLCTLGNHDYGQGWSETAKADALVDLMRSHDVTVLRNESIVVAGLQFVGMDDLWAKRFDPKAGFASADLALPTICLSHNPDTVDLGGWGDFSGWILAGHTHGGQFKPPFLAPPQLPVKNKRYTAGEFALSGGRRLYINRGLGFLRQVRFNARPEVTVFELVSA